MSASSTITQAPPWSSSCTTTRSLGNVSLFGNASLISCTARATASFMPPSGVVVVGDGDELLPVVQLDRVVVADYAGAALSELHGEHEVRLDVHALCDGG